MSWRSDAENRFKSKFGEEALIRLKREIKKALTIIVFLLAYVVWFRIMGFGLFCPIHLLTGLDCPGCGMSRAIVQISQFHFAEAWNFNRLSVTFVPVLAAVLFIREVRYIITDSRSSGNRLVMIAETEFFLIMYVTAIVYMVVRNLPTFMEWAHYISEL